MLLNESNPRSMLGDFMSAWFLPWAPIAQGAQSDSPCGPDDSPDMAEWRHPDGDTPPPTHSGGVND
ncbi:hypothetical protein [Rhodanobacter sp. Root561]|uniref:hypothetical protein n=1 Tax=Rhodanobacter sp. Root561 TaxID=1736560 RepID=UPI00138EEA6E|nr:hypothetical protein [Rhodanobacter sp. Root561]